MENEKRNMDGWIGNTKRDLSDGWVKFYSYVYIKYDFLDSI